MKKFILLLALVFSAIADGKPLEKITIILDWFANPDHAPLFVADAQGFFKAENLAVKFIGPSDPAEPPKFAAAKKADLAITYQPQLMLQVSQGLPLMRVATLIASPLDCLVVNAKGSIKKLYDLKGKKIGYSADSSSLMILSAMLHSVGLNLKDVEVINVHYNLTQALLSEKVDATIGMMRNFELIQIQLAGFTPQAFYPEEHGVPLYDELVIVTHRDNIADQRLPRFLRALELGTQYLINHPQASWQLFAKHHPELNNELNRQAWFATLPRFALRPAALDQARYTNFAKFTQTQRLIKNMPSLKNYALEIAH